MRCLLFWLIIVGVTPGALAQDAVLHRSEQAAFRVVGVAEDLEHPWALAFLPDGDYLVSERPGKLLRISPEGKKTDIKDVPPVYDRGQGGLLDLALEPGFESGGWLYFSYAATAEDDPRIANTEVARGRLDLAANRLSDIEVIFRAWPKVRGPNHWGSRLLFGPDGLLYITLGERFDYKEEAQDPTNHLGTVVRLTPAGKVPADNPFAGDSKRAPEIFTYGHRNAQGIALHPETGKIWIHEHGPRGGDEINILRAGANYGWPAVTFGIGYGGEVISNKTTAPGMADPIFHWTPSIAPSGMAFYTSRKFPGWRGDLFVGALAGQHLRRLDMKGSEIAGQEELLRGLGRIRDVRQGPDGFLYLLTDAPDGKLLRLEPA